MLVAVDLGQRSYRIAIGSGLLDRLQDYIAPLEPSSIALVTDRTVESLYAARAQTSLARCAPTRVICLSAGEEHKQWSSVERVIDGMAQSRIDRGSLVVALGGGVVGDIAGFAASIFMRGVRYVQVPTTLLAQVDSSVGGKTGVNHAEGKNLIGAFHQPSTVIIDIDTLKTLPPREISAGLAEVLKHGLLGDADYFTQVANAIDSLRAGDTAVLTQAVARSCEIKASIVGRDERESGERALLNLGHTFGHAVEAMTGYSRWLHGEAVGFGLVLAADLSRSLELLHDSDVNRITDAVARAGLPTRIEGLSASEAIEYMRGDKKAQAGEIRFVVLEKIGKASVRTVPMPVVMRTLTAHGFV